MSEPNNLRYCRFCRCVTWHCGEVCEWADGHKVYGRSPAMESLALLRQINAMPMEERVKASAAFVREGLAGGLFED